MDRPIDADETSHDPALAAPQHTAATTTAVQVLVGAAVRGDCAVPAQEAGRQGARKRVLLRQSDLRARLGRRRGQPLEVFQDGRRVGRELLSDPGAGIAWF